MSYEIVKRISKRKDGRIFVNSACNNVTPKHYSTWEFGARYTNQEEKDLRLFNAIIGNELNLWKSTSDKWHNALEKFYNFCKRNYIDTSDIWNLPYQRKGNYLSLKPYYKIFENYLNEQEPTKDEIDAVCLKRDKYCLTRNLTEKEKDNFRKNGLFVYALRESCFYGDGGLIETDVACNYAGDIITNRDLGLTEDNSYIPLDEYMDYADEIKMPTLKEYGLEV